MGNRKQKDHKRGRDENCRGDWVEKYGSRHRPERITSFPTGIDPPEKVRIYQRREYYLLQWWDKTEKKTLSERIDGDLLESLVRAREIDERLKTHRKTGGGVARLKHEDLVGKYLTSLDHRADAGEIEPTTVKRYASALQEHYLAFATQPNIERKYRYASDVNRDFQLELAAYLKSATVKPNGHPNSKSSSMSGQGYIVDVARAMYQWAIDSDQGNLLAEDFRNPFLRNGRRLRSEPQDQFGEPDITLSMATEFLEACDDYQRRLFVPLIFYGLRPSELCFLFQTSNNDDWLDVVCRPDLDYRTKGGRNKRLPVPSLLSELIYNDSDNRGLIYLRRGVAEGREHPSLQGYTESELEAEYKKQYRKAKATTAKDKLRVRDQVLQDAGGLNYDHIANEFKKLHRKLKWPSAATLKDFRHLCATSWENAGMPEHYRKYLLGQSTGRAAIVTYTHLNQVREHFQKAIDSQFEPLISVLES